MKKKILESLWIAAPAVLAVLAAFLFISVIPTKNGIKKTADNTWSPVGTAVGNCAGSVEGMTKGVKEGSEAGRQDSLDSPDVKITMIGKVRDIGILQVLDVSIKRSGIFSTDNGKNNTLYSQKCTASFSVDLNKAEISDNGSEILVTIPYPQLDEPSYESPEVIAHYETNKYAGSSSGGAKAYINSQNEIREKIEDELKNDAELSERAKKSALERIKALVEGVRVEDKPVTVIFAEESDNG